MTMLSRIGRSISRSSRSSLFNATHGCDGYGARTAAIANQSNGFATRSDNGFATRSDNGFATRSDNGFGLVNAYFSSNGAAKQAAPSFSPVFNPNFANPSFARYFSTDVSQKMDDVSDAKGAKNVLRPLSPHLLIYKPQSNSIMSILHRISGAYLTGAYVLFSLVYMKMGSICLTYPSFYQTVFYSSKLSTVALEIAALSSVYYVYQGIRHMSRDGIKEILADYVHHPMTRTGMMVCWRLLLILVTMDYVLYLSHLV